MKLVAFLVGLVFSSHKSSTSEKELIGSQIRLRISDVSKRFNLDAKTATHAMCPSCHKAYASTFGHGSSKPIYPAHCNNPILEKGPCAHALLDNTKIPQPVRPFVYHHVDDFVGSLLARKDLEKHTDSACDDLLASVEKNEDPAFVHDILQSAFMRSLQRHDGKLFIDSGDEGRLAFALCVDNFNINGLRILRASASCGLSRLSVRRRSNCSSDSQAGDFSSLRLDILPYAHSSRLAADARCQHSPAALRSRTRTPVVLFLIVSLK
jgi:hypothetical protein